MKIIVCSAYPTMLGVPCSVSILTPPNLVVRLFTSLNKGGEAIMKKRSPLYREIVHFLSLFGGSYCLREGVGIYSSKYYYLHDIKVYYKR